MPSQYAKHNIGAKGEDPRPPLIQDPRISVDNWIKGGLGPTISKHTIRTDQNSIHTDPKHNPWGPKRNPDGPKIISK